MATFEEYMGKEMEWAGRPYYAPDGTVWLLIEPSKISLPNYIRGTAEGWIKQCPKGLGRRIERSAWKQTYDPSTALTHWYFMDDKSKSPIDIDQWPGPRAYEAGSRLE